MMPTKQYTKMAKKFKSIEKNAQNLPGGQTGDVKWEGEEVSAESKTKLNEDTGTGTPVVLRFFEFGVNPEAFKKHKPTAQELFNTHINGIKSLLWGDGLQFYQQVEPRLQFTKDKKKYRFIIACLPTQVLNEKPQTISQLLA